MTQGDVDAEKSLSGAEWSPKSPPSYLEELEKEGPIPLRERIIVGRKARNLPRRLPATETGER